MKPLQIIAALVVFFFLESTFGQDSSEKDSVILEGAYRNPADFLNQKLLFKNDFKLNQFFLQKQNRHFQLGKYLLSLR